MLIEFREKPILNFMSLISSYPFDSLRVRSYQPRGGGDGGGGGGGFGLLGKGRD